MPNTYLAQSVADAELLLAYVNRNAKDVEPKTVEAVIEARSLLDQGQLKDEPEKSFYEAYHTLAHTVAPVTVASLRDSLDDLGEERLSWFFWGKKIKRSKATRACNLHKMWAFTALIILVVVQSYWVIGSSLWEHIPDLHDETSRQSKLQDKTLTGAESSAGKVDQAPEDGNEQKPPSDTRSPAAAEKADDKSDSGLSADDKSDARKILLAIWSRPWDLILKGDYATKLVTDSGASFTVDVLPALAATHVLYVLQVYILPLLYGWLGAMAYVIRTLSQEARDRTYRSENEIAYRLRIYLGVLSGLAIGWFFKPSGGSQDTLNSLPPFALAFVAGYSVDLLFTFMDRLLTAFSTAPAQVSKPGSVSEH